MSTFFFKFSNSSAVYLKLDDQYLLKSYEQFYNSKTTVELD